MGGLKTTFKIQLGGKWELEIIFSQKGLILESGNQKIQ